MTLRVEMPYAVFSIDVENGLVIAAAPIAKWMVGKKWAFVRRWIIRNKGSYMWLDRREPHA